MYKVKPSLLLFQ